MPDSDLFDKKKSIETNLAALFTENVLAKIYRTASKHLSCLPGAFPETVPQYGPDTGIYALRDADFWTCGFFPGSLYGLLERYTKFPHSMPLIETESSERITTPQILSHLQSLCTSWAEPLYDMATRNDTHDIGFIIMPSLRLDWELTHNSRSLDAIILAARSLATRYVPSAGAIRSWDMLLRKNLEITDMEDNMLLIIDGLCNLDLLYYAAAHAHDGQDLFDMATTHATTLLRTHLRPESAAPTSKSAYNGTWYSTCHVANIDPKTGTLKEQLTHQGYADDSTWSRGQGWAILGYAQTYMSTKDTKFLSAACGLAEYFLYRLETAPSCVEALVPNEEGGASAGRHVPLWDFDAPIVDVLSPLRDSSAGVIAANGMLVLSQALTGLGKNELAARFRNGAIDIVQDTLWFALAPEEAKFVRSEAGIDVADVTPGMKFEGILKFATANNNVNARKRYSNHGLVYGDYYLLEFANRLLRMGIV
ncbi:Six-hairpin glycosidase-like protein [Bisporella sp. PMI_857]|nr:Six-hairpin glycosidase-like protein [Bisporella sp. PMI_857]